MTQKRLSNHYELLREKWIVRHRNLTKNLWTKHKSALEWLRDSSKEIMVGSIASVMMLTHPLSSSMLAQNIIHQPDAHILQSTPIDKKENLIVSLLLSLPKEVASLTPEQESNIIQILTKTFNFPVTAEINSIRLNRNYGLIGAEQHLVRYAGDTMATHFDIMPKPKIYASGMAPGRGGWGYFDNSLQEKYYIAVPVFLCEGWKERLPEYVKFFRFRKILVVNPENGKAVVAVVGDAGPAEFTGKHLGGSPEVMDYLERVDGRQRGPVLYFFIDDPENKVPLGPIEVK